MAATFDRARRGRASTRLARVLGRGEGRELLPLDEATRRLRPFARRYVGLKPIPLRQVVGTDSRGGDFDREFHPRRPHIRERWEQLERAFPDAAFPPIVVYQLGDAYFVIDGHHRVAIARRNGMETIDAEVTKLTARWHLPADADVVELIHAEQERIFVEASGLGEIHPELRIRFSRPVGYIELLETVQLHGYHLMRTSGRVLSDAEIARSWYETVYEPTVDMIRAEGFQGDCQGATDADKFLWVWDRRRELMPEYGCRPLDETARQASAELLRGRRRGLLPSRRPRRSEGRAAPRR
jgi:ParB-like nuclease domain